MTDQGSQEAVVTNVFVIPGAALGERGDETSVTLVERGEDAPRRYLLRVGNGSVSLSPSQLRRLGKAFADLAGARLPLVVTKDR
jgi:hypothetical protein